MAGLRCAISGANGYVGSRISAYLKAKGCEVAGLGRKGAAIPFSLDSGVDSGRLKGFDAVIHCAYDFTPKRWEDIRRVNAAGSIALLRAAKQAGVRKIVYISSMSSFPGCKSYYGMAKLEVEAEAKRLGVYIIRPGLIYGKGLGSVMGNMSRLVSRFPVLPDIRTGSSKLYLCHNQDLCSLIYRMISDDTVPSGVPITAANDRGFSLKEILGVMASSMKKKTIFIPFPQFLLLFGLKSAEAMGLNQGIRSDSMLSLLNLDPSPDFSMTKKSGVKFREFSVDTLGQ
jgi:nucleoside-diphosphate-sugar epimerase